MKTTRFALVAVLSLAAMSASALGQAPAPAPAPAKAPAAALPSAEELLAKELIARGGKEAFEAVKQMTSTSTMEFVGLGLKGTTVSRMIDAGKVVTTVTLEGLGAISTGYDGTVGWSVDPTMGPRLLEGKELEQLRMDSSLARQTSIASLFEKATVVGETTWADKPAYEIELTSKDRSATIFLDKASSLITGMKMSMDTIRGSVPAKTTVLEFREFDGPKGKVTLPAKTEMVAMGVTTLVTVQTISFDAIPETEFALPPAIQALADEAAKAKAGAPETKPESKPEVKPESKPETKPETKPVTPAAPAK
jgi:hypothetical protein